MRGDANKLKSFLLRDMPEKLHREVKAIAAIEGLSLRDYIMLLIREDVEKRNRSRK